MVVDSRCKWLRENTLRLCNTTKWKLANILSYIRHEQMRAEYINFIVTM